MNKTFLCAAMSSVIGISYAAPVPGDFLWRQKILGLAESGVPARVKLSAETWDGCERGPDEDLRIFDANGAEWPFFIWTEPGEEKDTTIHAGRINEVEAQGTRQFELELGVEAAKGHDKIRVTFESNDYMRRTEIFGRESENDAWGLLGAGFLVRIPRKPVVQEDLIGYSRSTFRRLMVRVHPDPRRPNEIVPSPCSDSLPVRTEGRPEPRDESVLVPRSITGEEEEKEGVQALEFDSGLAHPLNEVDLSADGDYSSDVRVYCRRHETNRWRMAGSGRISRIEGAEFGCIPVSAGPAAHWRVEIERLDDAPLVNFRANGRVARTWIVFEAKSGAQAHLYFGASGIAAPRYDIARRVRKPQEVGIMRIDEREPNPEYRARRPAPKWLIPFGITIAALIMLAVIVNLLRNVSRNRTAGS